MDGFGEIAERLRRSTVCVSAGRRGQGSGIIVEPHGVIVTNAHATSFEPIQVQFWDGIHSLARLIKRDRGRDLAILRVSRCGLPAAVLADSDRIRVGELVIAVGNPLGFIGALTTGVVHAVGRVAGLGPMKWVQSDVRLAPGNSGGPLANAQGGVVGVNTMVVSGRGLAVPSNTVSRLLSGQARRSLGISTRPVEIAMGGSRGFGLLILEITKGSPANMASLLLGDILVGVDERSLTSPDDFEQELDGVGERVLRLQFLRGDRMNIRTVAARVGQRKVVAA